MEPSVRPEAGSDSASRGSTPHAILYAGPSMHPTLRAGDVLVLATGDKPTIRPGDVIVFIPPGTNGFVVHRVASVHSDGRVKTCGDSSPMTDPWLVKPDWIKGRVTRCRRNGRTYRVWGGASGLLIRQAVLLRLGLKRYLYRLLRPIYLELSRWRIFRRSSLLASIRVIVFNRPGGPPEMHLYLGPRRVGRLPAQGTEWQIDPPFRLLVDESWLPKK